MIQDIKPKKLINNYKPKPVQSLDKIMYFSKDKVLIKKNTTIESETKVEYLTYSQLLHICNKYDISIPHLQFLFSINEESFFLVDECSEKLQEYLIENYEMVPIRKIRYMSPKEYVYSGSTAWHLYKWYCTNRFCGSCGKRMHHDNVERMMRCPECGNMNYPRINPAVIIGLRDGERIMLTKYAGRDYKKYALIAGFAEIGETLEETVEREVMEEVGLKVKNITYYKNQPWGFDSDLLVGFFCDLDGDDVIKMDEDELAIAEWTYYKDIPYNEDGLSLTSEMMNVFKRQFEDR